MRFFLFAMFACAMLEAADKKALLGRYSNEFIELEATAAPDLNSVHDLLGRDVPDLVVVKMKIRVKTEKPLAIDLDDFTLRSDKDGQRSQPFLPGQLAGRGGLVVKRESLGGGTSVGRNPGPGWGGIPGTGGRPQQLPGNGGGIGNSAANETDTKVTETEAEKEKKENPLLAVLKEKLMPTGEIADSTSGLLYFQMEGKHKIKDLELVYKGPAGRFQMRFKP